MPAPTCVSVTVTGPASGPDTASVRSDAVNVSAPASRVGSIPVTSVANLMMATSLPDRLGL